MKAIWPPGSNTWVDGWLKANFSPVDIIRCHCEAAEINPKFYVPIPEDVYLLRIALAELIVRRGHGCKMVGDQIEIEFDLADSTVREAAGLK